MPLKGRGRHRTGGAGLRTWGGHLIPSRRTKPALVHQGRSSPSPQPLLPPAPRTAQPRTSSPVPLRSAPRRTAGAPPTAAARGRGCPGCPPLGSGGAPSPPPRPPHAPRPARPRPRSRAPSRTARIKVTPPRSPLRGAGGAAGPRTEVRLQLSPSLPSPGLGRGHREPRRTLTSTLRHPKPKDWPQSGSKTGRARDPAVPAQHSLARRADFRARVAALGANLPAMPDCMGRMEPGGSTA